MFLSFFDKKYPTPAPSAAPIIVPTTGTADPTAAPAAAAPAAPKPAATKPAPAPAAAPPTLYPVVFPTSPGVQPPAFCAAVEARFILVLVSCKSFTSSSTPSLRMFSPFGPSIEISFEFISIPKE